MIVGFGFLGAFVGSVAAHADNNWRFFLFLSLFILAITCCFYVIVAAHELGHLLAGFKTGYRPEIYNIGLVQWQRDKLGHFRLHKANKIPGAFAFYAGSKLAPEHDQRLKFMLLGGIFSHCLWIILACLVSLFTGWNFFGLGLVAINLSFIFANLTPYGITDGSKLYELSKYPELLPVFFEGFNMPASILAGQRLLDQTLQEPPKVDTTIAANQWHNMASQALLAGQTDKAKELLHYVLTETSSTYMHGLARLSLLEVAILERDVERAKELYRDKQVAKLIKIASPEYALSGILYLAYVEQNLAKAQNLARKALANLDNALLFADQKADIREKLKQVLAGESLNEKIA